LILSLVALAGGQAFLFGSELWGEPEVVTKPLMHFGLGELRCAAYSPNPDVPLIATGGAIGVVLWDASTGQEIRTFAGHTGGVYSVAFSPEGSRGLTGGSDGLTFLWDSGLDVGPFPTVAGDWILY